MPATTHALMIAVALIAAIAIPASAAEPLRVVSISDSPRDLAGESGADAFLNHLEKNYAVALRHVNMGDPQPDFGPLEDCDVVLFHPQGEITGDGAGRLQAYLESGPPLVSLRGAVRAFGEASGFDLKVLGARHSGQSDDGTVTRTRPVAADGPHPVFIGVSAIRSRHALHRFEDFAGDIEPLMDGAVQGSPPQTVAWSRQPDGRRIFHTSLGGALDYENDSVKRLIANALFWAAGIETRRLPPPDLARWERKHGDFTVPLRSRRLAGDGNDAAWSPFIDQVKIPVDVAAIVVADMRDAHWCPAAQSWVDAMAAHVNELVTSARNAGVLIVHVPSETSGFYDDHPARRRVEQIAALTIEGNYPIEPVPARDVALPPMPLPNANCPGGGTSHAAWTRQHPAIEIHETDIISGVGRQLYSYLLGNGIDTLFYAGIHANSTMIDRSHGMRQMSEWGMDCILIRDMTDIMFDPGPSAEIPHAAALEMVIEHLEKHLLPTVSSEELSRALENIKP